MSACALDVGTGNLLSARQVDGNIKVLLMRNCFFTLENTDFLRSMLESIKVNYVAKDDLLYVLGDSALELAASFNTEARRPMASGMLSSMEKESLPIIKLMISELLGAPQKEKEICMFSIPGQPINSERNSVYHEGLIKSLIESLGYSAYSINEGMAVIYDNLAGNRFSGIGISCGAGQMNRAIANLGVEIQSFSLINSGDYIDQMTAQAQGIAVSKVTQIKENQLDLSLDQDDIVLKTLKIYYENLLDYVIKAIAQKFSKDGKVIADKDGVVNIAIAGGTAACKGFIDLFNKKLKENENRFPFKVSDAKLAIEPLKSVVKGVLTASLAKERKSK
jgi:hypothetical protein